MEKNLKCLTLAITIILLSTIVMGVFIGSKMSPFIRSKQLVDAIKAGDCDQVEKLLQKGVDPNIPTAPHQGIWKYINTFVEAMPDTPLSIACKEGDLEIVALLLEYNANVNGVDGTKWQPIQAATLNYQENTLAIVKLLLENGADTLSNASQAPFALAAQMQVPENADGTLNQQAMQEITETVILLMDDNSNTHHEYNYLLCYAAQNGNLLLVQHLLENGTDTDIRYAGKTAYDYAVDNGFTDIANLLK